ncbi:hypothetical protein WA588_005142, partial [Blastocystis sp. NMH]
MEAHTSMQTDHCCYTMSSDDQILCMKCKRIVQGYHAVMDHDSDQSDNASSSSFDNRIGYNPFILNRFDGPKCSLTDLIEGLRSNRFHNIIVVAGAGISCASGIPDFRSASGLYRNLNKYPVPFLTDPSTIFSFRDFADFPIPFWILAKEMFYTNDQYHPTPAHFFLALLQKKGLLRRVYTQNIDGLDRSAGLTLPVLVEGHGTCSSCACIRCHKPYSPSIPQEAVNERRIPVCGSCGGLIKPDIVFFGEDLPDRFYSCVAEDCYQTDLVLVMGTSLQVHPMCLIPRKVPSSIPRVLINNQLVGMFRDDTYNNLPLIGDCQTLALTLIELCGWRSEYETLLQEYRSHHSTDFLWKDTYNFDTIEHNLQSFEDELQGHQETSSLPVAVEMEDEDCHEAVECASDPSIDNSIDDYPQNQSAFSKESSLDDTNELMHPNEMESSSDDNEDNSPSPSDDHDSGEPSSPSSSLYAFLHRQRFIRHYILPNDNRLLETFDADEQLIEEATMYFVVQIWKGEINNATQPNEDPSEQLIVREKDCLIKLNQANSRCFREILKWEYHS